MKTSQALRSLIKRYCSRNNHSLFMCHLAEEHLTEEEAQRVKRSISERMVSYTLSDHLRHTDPAYLALVGPNDEWTTPDAVKFRANWFEALAATLEAQGD